MVVISIFKLESHVIILIFIQESLFSVLYGGDNVIYTESHTVPNVLKCGSLVPDPGSKGY